MWVDRVMVSCNFNGYFIAGVAKQVNINIGVYTDTIPYTNPVSSVTNTIIAIIHIIVVGLNRCLQIEY